ncbi:MAG TPA: twin-arginine translocation signal domain-containing protein, partial [Polyangiales bacterium]
MPVSLTVVDLEVCHVTSPDQPTRRSFLVHTGLAASGVALASLPSRLRAAPAAITPEASRPLLAQGIQIGDPVD